MPPISSCNGAAGRAGTSFVRSSPIVSWVTRSSPHGPKRFGISDTEFSYIKARHVTAAKRNPYDVLGIEPSISNEGLKTHYRKIVSDNHPDKLIARGVPKEFVAIATEKIAVINEAYGQIAKERGI